MGSIWKLWPADRLSLPGLIVEGNFAKRLLSLSGLPSSLLPKRLLESCELCPPHLVAALRESLSLNRVLSRFFARSPAPQRASLVDSRQVYAGDHAMPDPIHLY